VTVEYIHVLTLEKTLRRALKAHIPGKTSLSLNAKCANALYQPPGRSTRKKTEAY
jgi:hypothetical protein